jgi:hypothetical protein
VEAGKKSGFGSESSDVRVLRYPWIHASLYFWVGGGLVFSIEEGCSSVILDLPREIGVPLLEDG